MPQGGNTGLVGGQTPHHGEVVLSLRRLDSVRDVDAPSNTMTCEAGVVLAVAQARAADADRLFPLSLGSEGSCTIGGNLSTNAGGTTALAYGVARDLALGVEVVLADGRVVNALSTTEEGQHRLRPARPLHRRRGHARHHHRRGAEAVPAAAQRRDRLRRRSARRPPRSQLLAIAQAAAAGTLTSFELMAEICIDFSVRHGPSMPPVRWRGAAPWYVLMEISSQRDDARAVIEAMLDPRAGGTASSTTR